MVIAVDREYLDVNGTRTGQVRALLQSGVEIEACYAGTPPWPLATALFDGPGEWFCLGPIGDRRQVLHDDFMFVGASSVGDTEWVEGGTGSLSAATDPSDGAGVVMLSPTTITDRYWIRKRDRSVTLGDDRPFWMSARVRLTSPADVAVGLADANRVSGGAAASTDSLVAVGLSTTFGSCDLQTVAGTSSTSVPTGESSPSAEWIWVDLMVVGGLWAAMWIDGSGPWVSTENVPSTSTRAVTPFVVSSAGVGEVDCVSLVQVPFVNSPDGVAIPAVPNP